jgi:hypothetical protein
MNKTEIITQLSKTRNDLFDNVALLLARAEGKIRFLNSLDFEGKGRITEGHSVTVAMDAQKEIQNARKALNETFAEISEVRSNLLSL